MALKERIQTWIEPELFQPFLIGLLGCLAISEFVRGALTLSLLPVYGRGVLKFALEWTTLAISIQAGIDNLCRSAVGLLIDRHGPRLVLVAGFLLSTGGLVVMMTVHSIVGLLMAAALYGFGVTPVWPAAISGVSQATPEAKRASFMGYLYMAWLAGMGAGPVLINFLIGHSFSTAFVALATVEFLGGILALQLVAQPRAVSAMRDSGSISRSPGGATTAALGDGVVLSDGAATGGGGGQRGGGEQHGRPLAHGHWQDVLRNVKDVAFLFPGMFVQTFAVSLLVPIMAIYARMVLGVHPVTFSSILLVGGAATGSLLVPAGKLVDRFGATRFLVPAFFVAGAILFIFPTVPSLSMAYAGMSLLGTAYAFILPSWNRVLDSAIEADKKATLWGVFMTVEGAGSTVGPYVGGLVWDAFSPAAPFHVSGGVILAMGLLYLVVPLDRLAQGRRHRQMAAQG